MSDEYGYRGWLAGLTKTAFAPPGGVDVPATRNGWDGFTACFWMVGFLGLAGLAWTLQSAVCMYAALVAAVLVVTCSRWRVRVSSRGVEYCRLMCGIPVERKHFLLDAEVALYEPWGADAPEGVEIRDPRGGIEDSTDCFGPFSSGAAQLELVGWIEAAMRAAREQVGERPEGIRCVALEGLLDSIRPTKWGRHGEVREAAASRALTIRGVSVPEGSTILFNDDRPHRDPRRDDSIAGIRLAGPGRLPHDFELRPGALVSFVGDRIWVHENGPGKVWVDGVAIYAEDVMFDAEGEPTRFTLAESVVVDGFAIPAESDVSRTLGLGAGAYWFLVHLAEPVKYEGVWYPPERMVTFDSGKSFLQRHSPRLGDATFDAKLQAAGRNKAWKPHD